MGVKVTEDSPVLQSFERVEDALYLVSVLVLSPVLICLLLLVVAPVSFIVQNNDSAWRKLKSLNIIVFKITKYIYRFLKVDRSSDVPRFVLFGFRTPVYYTYHLLAVAVMIAMYCLHQVWNITFLSSKTPAPCDEDTVGNGTECFILSLRAIQSVSSLISLVAAIIFVYAFVLEILLKFTKGRQSCHRLCDSTRASRFRLIRVVVAVLTQIFFVLVVKIIYIAYFITTDFGKGTSTNLFDRPGWFVVSLLVDIICFVMLTPWFLFEKMDEENTNSSDKKTTLEDETELTENA